MVKIKKFMAYMKEAGPVIYGLYQRVEGDAQVADNRYMGFWIGFYSETPSVQEPLERLILKALSYLEVHGPMGTTDRNSWDKRAHETLRRFLNLSLANQIKVLNGQDDRLREYDWLFQPLEVPDSIKASIIKFVQKRSKGYLVALMGITFLILFLVWFKGSNASEDFITFIEENPLEMEQTDYGFDLQVTNAKMMDDVLYITFDLTSQIPCTNPTIEAWLPKVTALKGNVMTDGQSYVAAFDLGKSKILSGTLDLRIEISVDQVPQGIFSKQVAYDDQRFEDLTLPINQSLICEATKLDIQTLKIIDGYPWLSCKVEGPEDTLLNYFDVVIRDNFGNSYPMEAITYGGKTFSQSITDKIHPKAKSLEIEILSLNQCIMNEYPISLGSQTLEFDGDLIKMEILYYEGEGTFFYMSFEDDRAPMDLPQLHVKIQEHWYPLLATKEDREYSVSQADLNVGGREVSDLLAYYFETYGVHLDQRILSERLDLLDTQAFIFVKVDGDKSKIHQYKLENYGPDDLQAFGYIDQVGTQAINEIIKVNLDD